MLSIFKKVFKNIFIDCRFAVGMNFRCKVALALKKYFPCFSLVKLVKWAALPMPEIKIGVGPFQYYKFPWTFSLKF